MENRENFVSFFQRENSGATHPQEPLRTPECRQKSCIYKNVNFENLYIPALCISVLPCLSHGHYAECGKGADLLLGRIYSMIKAVKELPDE